MLEEVLDPTDVSIITWRNSECSNRGFTVWFLSHGSIFGCRRSILDAMLRKHLGFGLLTNRIDVEYRSPVLERPVEWSTGPTTTAGLLFMNPA